MMKSIGKPQDNQNNNNENRTKMKTIVKPMETIWNYNVNKTD